MHSYNTRNSGQLRVIKSCIAYYHHSNNMITKGEKFLIVNGFIVTSPISKFGNR